MLSRAAAIGALALISLPLRAFAQEPPALPKFPMIQFGGNVNYLQVLKREEVQNHLHLTAKQKIELDDLLKNPPRTQISISADSKTGNDPDAIQRQIQEQLAKQRTSTEDRIRAVLKPEQYLRLKQLVLQWRGLLSLGDPATAEELKVSPAHRGEIARIMSDYNMKKSEIMMAAAEVHENNDGSGRVARMVKLDSRALQPGSDGFKKLTALKAEAEEKIGGVLSSEEKASWKAANGEPFTFRIDTPGIRF